MTISFSPRWSHYSWSNSGTGVDEESERQLILEMIRNCDSDVIKRYAESTTGGSVYVRTGIHTSDADSDEHIQIQLGYDREPWKSPHWLPYTAHIAYNNSNTPYVASMVSGLHSGGNRGRKRKGR